MYAFTYHRPTTLAEAAQLMRENEDAKFLAGGHTLLPAMKLRLAGPPVLIDLGRVEGMRGIARDAAGLSIGALMRHREVAESAEVKGAIPVLAELAGSIGDPAVRHRGTIGGSVANNDPAADYPAACLALRATIVTERREIAADDFLQGLFTTALEEDEIVTRVIFPVPDKAGYQKFRNPASRYPLVGVFVARAGGEVRVAVTGSGANGVFRLPEMEAALARSFSAEALDGIVVLPDDLASDIHADQQYRAHLIGVMARRAVQAAG
jgi:carbon-monoxide dehydrogenase medium subunit